MVGCWSGTTSVRGTELVGVETTTSLLGRLLRSHQPASSANKTTAAVPNKMESRAGRPFTFLSCGCSAGLTSGAAAGETDEAGPTAGASGTTVAGASGTTVAGASGTTVAGAILRIC